MSQPVPKRGGLVELANEDDDPRSARRNERAAEARALWRALEVLLASLKPSELEVGDGTFTKTLACVRSVLSDPSYWVATPPDDSTSGDASDDSLMTLFVCVNRVLLKLAARGAHEREALVRDGLVDLVVRCGESMQQNSSLSASEAAAALQTLQSLAVDSKNRPNLQVSQTIGLSIALMEKHSTVFAVQLRACQFLHQMALEEDCKLHIGRHGGLLAVTKALLRFAEEAKLVVTALDVLFFLCVELEYQDSSVENIPVGSVNASILQGVVSAVVGAMRHLQSVELVQANGVAVLNRFVHFGFSAFYSVSTCLMGACVLETIASLKALKGQIEASCHSQVASKETEARMVFIASRLQSVLDEESCALSCAATGSTADQLISADDDYDGYSNFIYAQGHPPVLFNASTHCEDDNGDELPVDSRGNTSNVDDSQSSVLFLKENTGCIKKVNQKADDNTLSVMMRGNKYNSITFAEPNQLDELCKMPNGAKICSRVHSNSTQQIPDTIAMHPRQGISNGDAQAWHDLCEANTREAQRIQIECHENTLNKEAEKWQDLYEAILRRSKEQAKLLNLQNVRITNHGNEHQQVLRRLRTLETSLDESNRRYEVEKAIRSAEAVQSEQLSLALETSLREAKSLAAQQSSASRELQQKESMRTEYMMRTRESNQDKQRMEVERDNALIRIEILKQEKVGYRSD
ncbi:unnamed protein product [Phytophthora lilii]|uniref:Unnamed protein product n=1 Tax=Phytophthora lilii TaxID=2077276 RepID=A0A9W6TCZ8_9STRA|nr:unnamed protein product [Phytophthora lilii]